MEVLFIAFIMFILSVIAITKMATTKVIPLPKRLDGREEQLPALAAMIDHVERHWDDELEQLVRQRLATKVRDPRDLDRRFIELKRFFVMALIYRDVPMYSEKVDVVWHEMLMFTRQYEQLCQRIFGHMLHHEPTITTETPDILRARRARFDWLYNSLFNFDKSAGRYWGRMFQYQLAKDDQEAVRNGTFGDRYFKRHDGEMELQQQLLTLWHNWFTTTKESAKQQSSAIAVPIFVYYTMVVADRELELSTSTSACSACSSCSSDSSCGSSCSSCGGGGD